MNRTLAQILWISAAAYERATLGDRHLTQKDGVLLLRASTVPATDMTGALLESVAGPSGTISPAVWFWNLVAWEENYRLVADPISTFVSAESRSGLPWWKASAAQFQAHCHRTGHDPLLRNGVIASMRSKLDDIFFFSWMHTTLTHWSPIHVLCTALHAWLIHHMAAGRNPFSDGDAWLHRFVRRWLKWTDNEERVPFRNWYRSPMIPRSTTVAIRKLCASCFDPPNAKITMLIPANSRCDVLLALQQAILFTRIATEYEVYRKAPARTFWIAAGLGEKSHRVFANFGPNATSLAAIAAPMLVSATGGRLPKKLVNNLSVFQSELVFARQDKTQWLEILASS